MIGKDLVNKMGYKNGLVLGLIISALGTLLFYPAANTGSYPLMLGGLLLLVWDFLYNKLLPILGNCFGTC